MPSFKAKLLGEMAFLSGLLEIVLPLDCQFYQKGIPKMGTIYFFCMQKKKNFHYMYFQYSDLCFWDMFPEQRPFQDFGWPCLFSDTFRVF